MTTIPGTLSGDDRQEISELLVRYATGIDRRDWVLFRTCFTDDCFADYGPIGVWHDAASITDWMERVHARCGHTMHRITNQTIAPSADGATTRSYVSALVLGPDNRSGIEGIGYYDDELVRAEQGWKIAKRRFTMVLQRTVET